MLTEEKLLHSLKVARKMKKIVENNPAYFPSSYGHAPNEAFLLGLLHDIGYEATDDPTKHASRGGTLLLQNGYGYWETVFYHGKKKDKYNPRKEGRMGELLNYCEMTTSEAGEDISMEDRLKEIEKQYGKSSSLATEAKELIEELKDIGFLKKLEV